MCLLGRCRPGLLFRAVAPCTHILTVLSLPSGCSAQCNRDHASSRVQPKTFSGLCVLQSVAACATSRVWTWKATRSAPSTTARHPTPTASASSAATAAARHALVWPFLPLRAKHVQHASNCNALRSGCRQPPYSVAKKPRCWRWYRVPAPVCRSTSWARPACWLTASSGTKRSVRCRRRRVRQRLHSGPQQLRQHGVRQLRRDLPCRCVPIVTTCSCCRAAHTVWEAASRGHCTEAPARVGSNAVGSATAPLHRSSLPLTSAPGHTHTNLPICGAVHRPSVACG